MSGAEALAATLCVMPPLDVSSAYVEHAAFIGRTIERLVGRGPDVDDLLQETFIVAFRRRGDFDGRAEVRTWLYAIAAHLCMRHRRSARRFLVFRGRLGAEPQDSTQSADANA